MTQYPNRRNPIIRHGKVESEFAQIPNDLARDLKLSHHAYRIAIMMRTHRDGWELSAKAIADEYGWGRPRVTEALHELEDAGLLAIRRFENSMGNRVFDEYHVNVARRFTPAESVESRSIVVLATGDGSSESTYVESLTAAG